jgi:hypothetical protein
MKTSPLFLSALFVSVLAASTSAEVLYGISRGFGATLSQVYEIDPLTAQISNAVQVSLPGYTVSRSLALAANPLDGTLWCVIQTSDNVRRLATIVPSTGVAAQVGPLANQITTLAFKADGTLLGVSGDGGNPAETLYRISTLDASLTLLFALGNGDDGETIAIHPSGLMYHSSGNNSALFESVDLGSQLVTPLGVAAGEAFSMGYSAAFGQMFLTDINSYLYTVNLANGARTVVGFINPVHDNRGLAFVGSRPATPFCFGDGTLATACPCNNNGSPGRGCNNSANTGGALLSAAGTTNPDTLVLTSSGELATALSIFLQGNASLATPVPFGDGVRCIGGNLERLYVENAVVGVVSAPQPGDPSITTRSTNLGDPIAPGSGAVRYYQTYYRDPNLAFCPAPPGNSWNVSNGVSITW